MLVSGLRLLFGLYLAMKQKYEGIILQKYII